MLDDHPNFCDIRPTEPLALPYRRALNRAWRSQGGPPKKQQNLANVLGKKQAHKGVFITTSEFNKNAVEHAHAVPQKIILIDGTRLADLMIEHSIGVTTERTVALKRIDSDYFEQG